MPLALAVLLFPLATAASDPPAGVKVVKNAAVEDLIARTPSSPAGRGGVVAEDEGYRVHLAERDQPGLAELHDGDTDVWFVIAGAATVVTGGTMVDAKVTGPGEQRAPSIRGGSEMAVAAGDLVTIRPGVPHWVKAVDGKLRYLVVKVHGSAAAAR
jgi:mannose-6-phosphate isomerase-like protein (cupin superfamily)